MGTYLTLILVTCLKVRADALNKKGGVIQSNTDTQVIVNRDSVLITLLYDTQNIEYIWNEFIENGESLIGIIGNNLCVEKIIADSKVSRYKIKQFLREHENRNINKRQTFMGVLGLLGGLTSLGLTTYEINQINGKLNLI